MVAHWLLPRRAWKPPGWCSAVALPWWELRGGGPQAGVVPGSRATLEIACGAGRDEIAHVVVSRGSVDMVYNKRIQRLWVSAVPIDGRLAPVAKMFAWPDAVVQHDTMLKCPSRGSCQLVHGYANQYVAVAGHSPPSDNPIPEAACPSHPVVVHLAPGCCTRSWSAVTVGGYAPLVGGGCPGWVAVCTPAFPVQAAHSVAVGVRGAVWDSANAPLGAAVLVDVSVLPPLLVVVRAVAPRPVGLAAPERSTRLVLPPDGRRGWWQYHIGRAVYPPTLVVGRTPASAVGWLAAVGDRAVGRGHALDSMPSTTG